jgi:ribonuclease P/MRP protein subunit POP5
MVRIKERYLLVHILTPPQTPNRSGLPDCVVYHQPTSSSLTTGALLNGIRAEVTSLFGDYGAGSIESGLSGVCLFHTISPNLMPQSQPGRQLTSSRDSVKYLSHATSTFIIRVSRDHYRLVWAALTSMNRVPGKDGKRCVFRVVRLSGTIRKAEEEAIRSARQLLLAASIHTAAPSPLELAQAARQPTGALDMDVEIGDDDNDEGNNSDMSCG